MMILLTTEIFGQSLSKPVEGYLNTFGAAASGGVFLDKQATFWGAAVDYSRVVFDNWIINVSFSYDQEHEDLDDGNYKITNTFTPSIAIGYAISNNIAAGIGLGKGLFDDDNEEKKIEYNSDGGWTIGLIGVYTFYQSHQHSFDVSGGIERGLSNPETDLTIELGYGFNF
jgi:hypothetical protein